MHPRTFSNLLREPLIQFLFLGVVIFAVDQYVLGNAEDPRSIVVDDTKRTVLIEIFEEGQGRVPNDAELDDLIVKWTQNEILYREARLMGLDKGDEMIRQRLILKMRNILFNNLVPETPSEEQLKAWFEENRDAYDKPALFDFEQFQLAIEDKSQAETKATELAIELGSWPHSTEYDKVIRRYHRRPGVNLKTVFGDEHGQKLIDSSDNTWVAVSSDKGWHVARITKRYEGKPADFDKVRAKVVNDWKSETARIQLSKQVQEIADQYELKLEYDEQVTSADAEPLTEQQTIIQESVAQR